METHHENDLRVWYNTVDENTRWLKFSGIRFQFHFNRNETLDRVALFKKKYIKLEILNIKYGM